MQMRCEIRVFVFPFVFPLYAAPFIKFLCYQFLYRSVGLPFNLVDWLFCVKSSTLVLYISTSRVTSLFSLSALEIIGNLYLIFVSSAFLCSTVLCCLQSCPGFCCTKVGLYLPLFAPDPF